MAKSSMENCCQNCKDRDIENNCHGYCTKYTARVLSDIDRRHKIFLESDYKSYKRNQVTITKKRVENARRNNRRKMH